MLNIEQDYTESLSLYEESLKKINMNNNFSNSQLEAIDQLLISLISSEWKKTAFIIGRALEHLKKSNLISLFASEADSITLLTQRIINLVDVNKIKANGDVRAIRFSEIKI